MRHQSGQSMTEFLVIMPVMLLLIMGAIQFVFIYQTKTTLNYATFEAVRAGSLENASIVAVRNGFTRGITPLFARFATTDNPDNELANKVLLARETARSEVANGFVKFELLNPTDAVFQYYRSRGGEIPNDNLSFRTERVAGLTIQDANLLKIRITYCMKLIVPVVDSLIVKTIESFTSDGFVKQNCLNDKRFPIVSQAIIRMQSPARKCNGGDCFD